jgi:hypothetical protein
MLCKLTVELWDCQWQTLLEFGLSSPLTADVGPVSGRCRARQRQTSGYLWEFCLSGPSTADVGLLLVILSVWPVDGRRRATFGNFVCLARWRQTSGPLTADVGPVDGRRQFAVVGLPTNAGVDFVQFDLESRNFFLTRLKSQYDKSTRTIYQTFFPLEKQKRHYFAHAKITPKNTNLEVWIINHIYW